VRDSGRKSRRDIRAIASDVNVKPTDAVSWNRTIHFANTGGAVGCEHRQRQRVIAARSANAGSVSGLPSVLEHDDADAPAPRARSARATRSGYCQGSDANQRRHRWQYAPRPCHRYDRRRLEAHPAPPQ
jgi:hypothetical protein